MTQEAFRKAALAFLQDYTDPEIDKRLYFDFWADRTGLDAVDTRRVWQEVRNLAHQAAAEKRRKTWQLRRARGELAPAWQRNGV